MIDTLSTHYNYWIFAFLLMVGLYSMMAKNNLMKKLIGMNIFQWAIILYFISIGAKRGAQIPIVTGAHGQGEELAIHAAGYINPLPHVLMLTAIVVGVATTGISLALLIAIHKKYDTIEEDEIIERLQQ
jgi:multicomponent Na+:H+ antiporter subunit C